ncbi:TetR/AcrR family transcriptional regulator C-terminal domain-containing protein [Nocardia terpenica]|uniref:TetR family transcriptional regulator n=1 Tax=Nocardia terpenica TaxID=455432 RepID=A0A164NJ90_9NOCA|nr:TetR/AcrR family transcriptional regulator [Nocardia terpenica]KZM74421.1 TetR family transcriptional regulator [Nocardia terpenica]MBF6059857.1 TetR/AcrR family transcriptional regulator C-terminal domain-containing protein [Nocardia terpenica]MBF6102602.1 TetR/AcrR family transcriptional regulator C-terminal domain-containing protein [Nocardia terpenica]MBF6111207.1 TetR/AcrR family transcriptional regulator C-terminal domain-containing protein [Nocardia terpenica]MBF6117338.1 TetR/AcrR f
MPSSSQPATLVWMRDRPRGGRPVISEEKIVGTAIRIADAEGLDALSMRRIAAEMGSGTTSLYRHIANKDELIELMVDAVYAEAPFLGPAADWQAEMAAHAREFRALLLRHPWLGQQASRRPALGPNVIRHADHALGLVGAATDDPTRVALMVDAVNTYVLGSVATELAELEAQRSTGMTEDEWRNSVGEYVQQVVESGKYPHFNRRIIEAEDPDADERFEFGLTSLLAGLAITLGHE